MAHFEHGAPYEYAPLDPSSNTIRLLRLTQEPRQPRSSRRSLVSPISPATTPSPTGPSWPSRQPIQCVLETYDISQCPPYTALSYTWGDPHPTKTISVNSHPMRVRANLHAVLSVLRHKDYTFFSEDHYRETALIDEHFWIDAICINQADLHERGHQVGLMAHIYTRAACVIAWLGPECQNSCLAITAIRTGDLRVARKIRLGKRSFLPSRIDDVEEVQAAVTALFRRAYWRRMWVVQEFTLPRNLLLLCGSDGVWWENLREIVARGPFDLEFLKIRDEKDPLASWWILGDTRCYTHGSVAGDALLRAQTLDQLLEIFCHGECIDARDRVYALLSLVKKHPDTKTAASLQADYTIPTNSLYYRILAHHRHAVTLERSETWARFRTLLADALKIDREDKTFKLYQVLYDLTELYRVKEKSTRVSLHRRSMAVMMRYFDHVCRDSSTTSTLEIPEAIKLRFGTFPHKDDPEAWQYFTTLLMKASAMFARRTSTALPASDTSANALNKNDCRGLQGTNPTEMPNAAEEPDDLEEFNAAEDEAMDTWMEKSSRAWINERIDVLTSTDAIS